MNIYHLELEIYFALEEPTYISNVYSTMEKAIETGKKYLEKEMRNQYTSGYQIKGQDNISLDELFSLERTDYIFKVTETDLEYAENFKTDLLGKRLWNVRPTHIEYYYNYKGEFQSKTLNWIEQGERCPIETLTMNKKDLEKYAGTKFKIGDIVTVKSEDNRNLTWRTWKKLFVVRFLPTHAEETEYFKNTYAVASTYDRGEIESGILTWEFDESELEKYEGEIDRESPIGMLQRIIKGDVHVPYKVWQDLENGLVSFDTRQNYKEYLKENTYEFEDDDWGYYSAFLPPNNTGLSVFIYPCKNTGETKDFLPKIRVHNNNEDYNDTFFLSLEKEPRVVIGESKLSKGDFEQVCNFIKNNLEILLKHFDFNEENFSDYELWEELEKKGAIKR